VSSFHKKRKIKYQVVVPNLGLALATNFGNSANCDKELNVFHFSMNEIDLEGELFDAELYGSPSAAFLSPGARIDYLLSTPLGASCAVAKGGATRPSWREGSPRNAATFEARTKVLRRKAEEISAQARFRLQFETCARVDQQISGIIAARIAAQRRVISQQHVEEEQEATSPPPKVGKGTRKGSKGRRSHRLNALRKKFLPSKLLLARSGQRIDTGLFGVFNFQDVLVDVEETVEKRLQVNPALSGQDTAAILEEKLSKASDLHDFRTLLQLHGLPKISDAEIDSFDKTDIVRKEFDLHIHELMDEIQIHSFLSLMLCGLEHDTAVKVEVVRKTCGHFLPHLYLFEKHPELRFSVGRAAACYVRILIQLYHFMLDPEVGRDDILTAIEDLKFIVKMLTQVFLLEFPILRTAELRKESVEERTFQAHSRNHPLNEKASLVVRVAVEEAVAVPIWHGVLRPLYSVSDKFALNDNSFLHAAERIFAKFSPQQILEMLQVRKVFWLENVDFPYGEVISILRVVWDPDSLAGGGPTAKARLLVKASRTIPLSITKAGITKEEVGADDLLPIFCYSCAASRPKNIASLSHFLSSFVEESLLTAEAGYVLALLETAIQVIPTLGMKERIVENNSLNF